MDDLLDTVSEVLLWIVAGIYLIKVMRGIARRVAREEISTHSEMYHAQETIVMTATADEEDDQDADEEGDPE